MKVDKVEVCKPIESLINLLISYGFEIVASTVSKYHFHELYFKLKGSYSDEIENIQIDKIQKIYFNTFSCSCHWSII